MASTCWRVKLLANVFKMKKENIFCKYRDLEVNEAHVESLFVDRLLAWLGWGDSDVKRKSGIKGLRICSGTKSATIRPDYVLELNGKPVVILDAKSTRERIESHVDQVMSYCSSLNAESETGGTVAYYVLTNGAVTSVYKSGTRKAVLSLDFLDFKKGSSKLQELEALISKRAFKGGVKRQSQSKALLSGNDFEFTKPTFAEIDYVFSWCHQQIYKKDNISQAAAFAEFIKLMFIKLDSDKVFAQESRGADGRSFKVSSSRVLFSVGYLEGLAAVHKNPASEILFKGVLEKLEEGIANGGKKRIFAKNEAINLSSLTISLIVGKLEKYYLYGMDGDLNGRLFEVFLSSTMRGKDLGQYFTPRSVVKLAIGLADLPIDSNDKAKLPIVMDPCCGSGGFLISALWDMWSKIEKNPIISKSEAMKSELKKYIAEHGIIGVDVGREPAIAKIARANMYLHGDGGSRIFEADSLDYMFKNRVLSSDLELNRDSEQFGKLIAQAGGVADCIITNPPFSKVYESRHPTEKNVLEEYDLAYAFGEKGKGALLGSVKSSVLFIELYSVLLKESGRVVAIVDDSILGGTNKMVRDFIRRKFIIEAVVSLPGDAFQRSNARVKTSILVLRKKAQGEEQGDVFMWYCEYVGVDDSSRQRQLSADEKKRNLAEREVDLVVKAFHDFRHGRVVDGKYLVHAMKVADRLDVKSCLLDAEKAVPLWEERNFVIKTLEDVAVCVSEEDEGRVVDWDDYADGDCYVRVSYDGIVERGDCVVKEDTAYKQMIRVKECDIIVSNINAINGAIGVARTDAAESLASSEYTILRLKDDVGVESPYVLWNVLRSLEVRKEMLIMSSGMGRTRVSWSKISKLKIPIPSKREQVGVDALAKKYFNGIDELSRMKAEGESAFWRNYQLDSDEAKQVLAAFKPPQ